MHNQRQVVAGNFDAETMWRNEVFCKLPFIPDTASINITSHLDEILFLLCGKEDILITNKAFDQTLLQYLNSLGIYFECNRKDVDQDVRNGQTDVFTNLLQYSKLQDILPNVILENRVLNTFAVTEAASKWCEQCKLQYDYPNMDIIKTVNSKLYSYHLRNELYIDVGSKLAMSSEDMMLIGNEILSAGKNVIVKDMFGVSGKGNILINSMSMLQRIVKFIQNQQNQGKKVEFLLEPFLEKELDFTCIAFINKDGSSSILDIQCMYANGFAYSGTAQLTLDLKEKIYQSNYVTVVSEVCKALYQSGYYGDVCIDSMILKNNEFVPVVEINARKSMTYMKYHLDQFLSKHNLRGKFTYAPFIAPIGFTVEKLINRISEQNLLFTLQSRTGIMPLSANTLNLIPTQEEEGKVNALGKTKSKGRLYYAIVGESMEDIEKLSLVATAVLKEYGNNQ